MRFFRHFLLSTMNLFVKMLGSNIPSGEIAFFRGLFGTVAVLIVMYIKGHPLFHGGPRLACYARSLWRFWHGV